jgi:hypothetical protein
MSADQIKVVGGLGVLVANDKEHSQTLGLGLDQTLHSQKSPAATPLLVENTIGLGREARKVIVYRVGRLFCQRGLKVLEESLEPGR